MSTNVPISDNSGGASLGLILPAISRSPSKLTNTSTAATTPRAQASTPRHGSSSEFDALSSSRRHTTRQSLSSDHSNANESDSSERRRATKSTPVKPAEVIPHDIDFIGTGTFQVSQLNLLQKRSLEPLKSSDAMLSARGKSHRNRELFLKEAASTSAIIATEARNAKRLGQEKPTAKLLTPYFQRALACERLKQIDRAIADYSMCIVIDNTYAPAYFNRSGLYNIKGMGTQALADIDKAISLDPSNIQFRNNRALLLRQQGSYLEAIAETIVCRAVDLNPALRKDLASGHELQIDSDQLISDKPDVDPVVTACQATRGARSKKEIDQIVDFLIAVKFFAAFQKDTNVLHQIAQNVELHSYRRGGVIFEEGDHGNHFYMILDGEVSIIKIHRTLDGEFREAVTLVKLYRGQSFGETALEHHGGLRSAGAVASQPTKLLSLHKNIYRMVTNQYREMLYAEAKHVLASCPVFAGWKSELLDKLAGYAEIQMYGANTEILKAGDPVRNLYIIKKGIIKLSKCIDKPNLNAIKFGIKTKSGGNVSVTSSSSASSGGMGGVGGEVPGLWVMEKNWRDRLESFDTMGYNSSSSAGGSVGTSRGKGVLEQHQNVADFTVGVLGSGQVFGELAVLDPEGEVMSPVSAISFTPVELYVFESEALVEVGAAYDSHTTNTLNDSINLHNPPGEKLAYYFRQKYIWEKRKDDLLQNVAKESSKSNGGKGAGGGLGRSLSGSASAESSIDGNARGGRQSMRLSRKFH